MEILKILLEEQLLIKYCVIKHLILLNTKCDGYQRRLASMVYKFFDNKTSGSGIKNGNTSDQHPSDLAAQQLAEELHNTNN